MRKPYGILWILVLLFAVLMSLPWLVPHLGFLSLFGFVPLLCADRVADQNGVRRFWIWHYSAFVLWNAATTFWVCNATVGGGIFAVLANALQMSLIFGLFRFSKKRFGGILPYLFLMFFWLAWERWYLVQAQISWPWLVLGNAFARSIGSVQWYEYTGTLGGSLWIWLSNLGIFALMVSVLEGTFFRWRRFTRWCSVLGVALVLALPFAASAHIWHHFTEDSEGTVDVVIAQPDFDPYQKFKSMTQEQQNEVLLTQFSEASDPSFEGLLIAPETFTGDIFLNDVQDSKTWAAFSRFLQGRPGANLLFGASTYEYFQQASAPSILARKYGNGWLENRNSAFCTDASGRYDVFHKSKLVVGVEMTPYPKFFVPIDDKLGGLMGRCIGQPEVTALNYTAPDSTAVPFGCAICYESVYPEYCIGYVNAGAKFMTIITNDAWWGDTPGYRQHASFASLRAIELRRDIARCGNTGISGFINQRGEYVSSTPWWEQTTLSGKVNFSGRRTFFVEHGDIVGRVSTLAFLLLLAWLFVSLFIRRRP